MQIYFDVSIYNSARVNCQFKVYLGPVPGDPYIKFYHRNSNTMEISVYSYPNSDKCQTLNWSQQKCAHGAAAMHNALLIVDGMYMCRSVNTESADDINTPAPTTHPRHK